LRVLASGAYRVDTTALARRLDTVKINRADPEFVLEHTGQRIGGVAPIGHPSKIRTVVDTALAAFPLIWAGAGDENTMFATSFTQLLALTDGIATPVT